MKGKINERGCLMIARPVNMQKVDCQLSAHGMLYCSDDCCKFQEPVEKEGVTWLQLCNQDCLTFTDFVDERVCGGDDG